MGQDTPHRLPATRCPPWPAHGCQGPQKSGSVGKPLQDTAGLSQSTLGWERAPGAEQGQGRGCYPNSMVLGEGGCPELGRGRGCYPSSMVLGEGGCLELEGWIHPWCFILGIILLAFPGFGEGEIHWDCNSWEKGSLCCSVPILQIPGWLSTLGIPFQHYRDSLEL